MMSFKNLLSFFNIKKSYRVFASSVFLIVLSLIPFTTNAALWTQQTNSGNRNWTSVTQSSDGTKLAATVFGGYIYTSSNSGSTWTQQTSAGSRSWRSVAMSADGTKLAASGEGQYIYTSTNSGSTWTQQTGSGSRFWRTIVSSSDGTKLAAVVTNGNVFTSTDSGVTWTQQSGSGSHVWFGLTSSSDGTKLAATDFGGYIYTSSDSGVTWTQRTSAGSRNWFQIASSADGTKLAAVDNTTGGYIYTSTDSGATWTQRTGAGAQRWESVASSADGMQLVVGVASNGYIFSSNDGGVTWNQQSGAGQHFWTGLSSTPDGTKIAATDRWGSGATGGYIYTAGPDTTAPSVSISLPSNGSTLNAGDTIEISADANDNDSVAGVKFYIDNILKGSEVTSSPFSINWDTTLDDVGNHTIYAVARDGSNNFATSTSVTVDVEALPPVVTIYTPYNGQQYASQDDIDYNPPYVDWGNSITCEYSYDGTNYTTVDCSNAGNDITLPNSQGSYMLHVRGTNNNGATDSSVNFTIDLGPHINFNFPYANDMVYVNQDQIDSTPIDVYWDNATLCQYSYDNVTFSTINCNNSTGIEILNTNGIHTLYIQAGNGFGTSTANVSYTVKFDDYIWYKHTNSPASGWASIAASADGIKLVAARPSGYIYTSNDAGETWTQRTSAGLRNWSKVVSSADGTKIAIIVDGGYIYTSTDSGATWTEQTNAGTRNWGSIALSADGMKLAATVYDDGSGNPDYIYTSADGGTTWTQQTDAGAQYWTQIASSADGTKLVAGVPNSGYIYTSTDSGATWTQQTNAGSRNWTHLTSSADGTKLAAIDFGGYIYTSNDSGVNWTAQQSPISYNPDYGSIVSSADGSVLAVINASDHYLFVSTNDGVSWDFHGIGASKNWIDLAMSSDGTKIALAAQDDNIYTNYSLTPIDTTSPVISSIVANPTETSATITWVTNENSDSKVVYGLTTSYGSATSLNTNLLTSHTATLSGLTSGTTYNYKVVSKDASGNISTSTNQTFTTNSSGTGGGSVGGGRGYTTIPHILTPHIANSTATSTKVIPQKGCEPGKLFNTITGVRCTTAGIINPVIVPNQLPIVWLFTKNLQLGTVNGEVKLLQQYLNTHGFIVSVSGAGSNGHETTLFGAATKAALIKFQKAKQISPASGYFGPLTRAYISTH